jgi:hypothetical protein
MSSLSTASDRSRSRSRSRTRLHRRTRSRSRSPAKRCTTTDRQHDSTDMSAVAIAERKATAKQLADLYTSVPVKDREFTVHYFNGQSGCYDEFVAELKSRGTLPFHYLDDSELQSIIDDKKNNALSAVALEELQRRGRLQLDKIRQKYRLPSPTIPAVVAANPVAFNRQLAELKEKAKNAGLVYGQCNGCACGRVLFGNNPTKNTTLCCDKCAKETWECENCQQQFPYTRPYYNDLHLCRHGSALICDHNFPDGLGCHAHHKKK